MPALPASLSVEGRSCWEVGRSDGVLDGVNTADNGTLAPGQSTTFGFQGTHDGTFDLPTCSGN